MKVTSQLKVGVAVPCLIMLLWLFAWGAVHAMLFFLALLTGHPLGLLVLACALFFLFVIPFFSTVVLLAVHAGIFFSLAMLTNGLPLLAWFLVFAWCVGNLLMLWIRRWPANWEKRNEGSLILFWQQQVFIGTNLMCYLHPSLLGCLGLYLAYGWLRPFF